MVPFLVHYLPAAREAGLNFNNAQDYGHPSTWSWWNTDVVNWWWGWIDRRWPVQETPFFNELRLGLGFVVCSRISADESHDRTATCTIAVASVLNVGLP